MREMAEDNLDTFSWLSLSSHSSAVKEMDGDWRQWRRDRHAGHSGREKDGHKG